jgi:hypothetical protein
MVLDGDTLLFFDVAQHPTLAVRVETLTGRPDASVSSAVIAGERLYLLSGEGLFIVPDPRISRGR